MSKKERIKLFVLTLTIFTIVGFGMKWVLFGIGPSIPLQHQQSTLSQESFKSIRISQRDVSKAQQVVTQFLPIYFKQDKSKLREMCTERLFSFLQKEIENPLKKQDPQLDRVEKLGCNSNKDGIHCFVTVTVAESEGNRSTLEEQVYEVTLRLREMEWLVDEVNVHGSFE